MVYCLSLTMLIPEEALLHFVWQFRLYNQKDLKTINGEHVTVIDPGQYNQNAGPDFEFAKLQIGNTLWSGHVEIHVSAKDWYHHKHHLDPKYNSTILHIVWEYNYDALRLDDTKISTVELKNYINPTMLLKYQDLMNNLYWIPCEQQVKFVNSLKQNSWLERMAVERMESKFEYLSQLLENSKNHWEKVLLVSLGRAFGMKVNAIAFEHLVQKIEFSLLLKYQTEPLKLEALLFGTSGLIPAPAGDEYTRRLSDEFAYLQKLHHIDTLSETEWKFHRMRPYNFPTFRIAQLAALYQQEVYWFEKILKTENLQTIRNTLKAIQVNRYWEEHFRFSTSTSAHTNSLSDTFINHIIINCLAPVLFAFGKFMDNEHQKSKAIEWLYETQREENNITRKFETLGLQNSSAGTSQGLLHLKKNYCEQKKCLSCAIGLAVLKS